MDLENNTITSIDKPWKFTGRGWSLFKISFVNALLTAVTIGIYSFWAKIRVLKFFYSETEFYESPFEFDGTGGQLFKAFFKAIGILILCYILIFVFLWGTLFSEVFASSYLFFILIPLIFFFLILGILSLLLPLSVNSRLRYRFGHTLWRGIRLGYAGRNKTFLPLYLRGFWLSVVTLGIYSSWFSVKVKKYVFPRIHFGNLRFFYEGKGKELFLLHLKGILLSIITLGVYLFWYAKKYLNYNISHISVRQNENQLYLVPDFSASKIAKVALPYLGLFIITLGIALPWIQTRIFHFMLENSKLLGTLDPDGLMQNPAQAGTGVGEDLTDLLDFGDFGWL